MAETEVQEVQGKHGPTPTQHAHAPRKKSGGEGAQDSSRAKRGRIPEEATQSTEMPPPANNVFVMSEKENTHFQKMWPHLRDNLKRMNRINDDSVPNNLKELWSQPAEE